MKIIVQRSENAVKTLHLLSNLTVKNIVNHLKENGPSSPSRIAKALNISPSTSSRCLQDMRRYNIVKAEWKMESIDDRPEKIYELVPNILRFEFVLSEPELANLNPEWEMIFTGNSLTDFKSGDNKGVYVSLDTVPFRFDGLEAELLKECSKGWTIGGLREKYKEKPEAFDKSLKRLVTIGLINLQQPKE